MTIGEGAQLNALKSQKKQKCNFRDGYNTSQFLSLTEEKNWSQK